LEHFFISLVKHFYEKSARFRKLGSIISALTIEEDQVVVAWVLTMQKVGLSIDQQ
jgi:Na+-transporting NADH:ubiquinone oxidoreductase subunit NqrD